MNGLDTLSAHKMADGHAGELGVAAPFALAGHDEVEVELSHEADDEDLLLLMVI